MTTSDFANRTVHSPMLADPRWASASLELDSEQHDLLTALIGAERATVEPRDAWDVREVESESSTTEVERRRRERMFVRLRAIDEAIGRLNAGTYGLCVECAEPISPKRLEIDAAASRCVACQSTAESGRTPSL